MLHTVMHVCIVVARVIILPCFWTDAMAWQIVLHQSPVLGPINTSKYPSVMDFRRHTRCSRGGSLLGEPREQGNNWEGTKQTGFKSTKDQYSTGKAQKIRIGKNDQNTEVKNYNEGPSKRSLEAGALHGSLGHRDARRNGRTERPGSRGM